MLTWPSLCKALTWTRRGTDVTCTDVDDSALIMSSRNAAAFVADATRRKTLWEFLSLHWSVLRYRFVCCSATGFAHSCEVRKFDRIPLQLLHGQRSLEGSRHIYASISRNFPFRPHWNVSLLLCQVWCPRMTLLLWLLPRRSEPTEKRCWCQKRNCCNFRPLHFVLTGWVAEELSSLCGAFPRTQSSWDPDLLGGHVLLSYCNCENKTQTKATDIWDWRTRATKRTLSVRPHQICRLHACLPQHLARIKDGYLLLLLQVFSLVPTTEEGLHLVDIFDPLERGLWPLPRGRIYSFVAQWEKIRWGHGVSFVRLLQFFLGCCEKSTVIKHCE